MDQGYRDIDWQQDRPIGSRAHLTFTVGRTPAAAETDGWMRTYYTQMLQSSRIEKYGLWWSFDSFGAYKHYTATLGIQQPWECLLHSNTISTDNVIRSGETQWPICPVRLDQIGSFEIDFKETMGWNEKVQSHGVYCEVWRLKDIFTLSPHC